MRTLEQELRSEKHRIEELRTRALRRLGECREEATSLQAQGASAAGEGDTRGAGEIERHAQKILTRARRYEDVVRELEEGGDQLAAEVLLARLQGPEVDVLVGEVERNRELIVQRTTALLRSRSTHRALRQRWSELNDKIRTLRRMRGLPPPRSAVVDFRIHVTPATYVQKPDGPTYRDVADLLQQLGL